MREILKKAENSDPQYGADSVLSLVKLTHFGSGNKYTFRDGEMASELDYLAAALGSDKPTTASEAAARSKASEKRTQDQSGASEGGAGLGAHAAKKGAHIHGLSSRSGRSTTRGNLISRKGHLRPPSSPKRNPAGLPSGEWVEWSRGN